MTSLRQLADGKPCYGRLPGHCSHNSAETVLAHLRMGGVAGVATKPPDICGLPLCLRCHNVADGREKTQHSRAQVHADLLRGLVQWLSWLEREGHIRVEVR